MINKLKSKKLLLSLLFLIIVIVSVVLSYFVLNNKNKEASKKLPKNQLSEKDTNKIKAYKAFKYASYVADRSNGIDSFTPDELSELILWYGDELDTNYKYVKTNSDDEEIYQMKSSVVTSFISKYFGPNISYDLNKLVGTNSMLNEKSSILETVGIYADNDNRQDELTMFCGYTYNKYIADSNLFEITKEPGCGGLYDDGDIPELHSTVAKFEKAVKKDDELTVTLKAIYLTCNPIVDKNEEYSHYKCKVYKDYQKEDLIENKKVKVNKGINIKDYEKDASTITMKFKYNDETKEYYFVSSTNK